MPYITNRAIVKTNTKGKAEAIEAKVDAGLSQEILVQTVPIMGLIMHPESARHMEKNASIAISKATSLSFVVPSNMLISWIQCEKFIPEQQIFMS